MGKQLLIFLMIFASLFLLPIASAQSEKTIYNCKDISSMEEEKSFSYQLAHDIDFENCGKDAFNPIGGKYDPFTGSLDGRGFAIKNLQIDESSSDVGLFSSIANGEVENLSLENIRVSGGSFTGGLAGRIVGQTNISRVSVEGEVSGKKAIGGVVGQSKGNSKLINVFFQGQVSSNSAGSSNPGAGGIVGAMMIKNSTIEKALSDPELKSEKPGGLTSRLGFPIGGGNQVIKQSYHTYDSAYHDRTQSDTEVEEVINYSSEEIKGEKAEQKLEKLDFQNTWKTRESKLPTLRWGDAEKLEEPQQKNEQKDEKDEETSYKRNATQIIKDLEKNITEGEAAYPFLQEAIGYNESGNQRYANAYAEEAQKIYSIKTEKTPEKQENQSSGNSSKNQGEKTDTSPQKDKQEGDQKSRQETKEETKSNRSKAEKEIKEAKKKIEEGDPGYQTLVKAENAFEKGNYTKAKKLASEAQNWSKTGLDPFSIILIVVALTILIMLVIAGYFISEVEKV